MRSTYILNVFERKLNGFKALILYTTSVENRAVYFTVECFECVVQAGTLTIGGEKEQLLRWDQFCHANCKYVSELNEKRTWHQFFNYDSGFCAANKW